MAQVDDWIAEFLRGRRIAVAGVSRGTDSAANPIFRRLRQAGYDVVPVNPKATEVEGAACFPDLASIPGDLDGLVVATHPDVSAEVVRQAAQRKIPRVWLHRSFGRGSVSDEAVRECATRSLPCIVGGCPLMYCEPIDLAHRCMRAWLRWRGRIGR